MIPNGATRPSKWRAEDPVSSSTRACARSQYIPQSEENYLGIRLAAKWLTRQILPVTRDRVWTWRPVSPMQDPCDSGFFRVIHGVCGASEPGDARHPLASPMRVSSRCCWSLWAAKRICLSRTRADRIPCFFQIHAGARTAVVTKLNDCVVQLVLRCLHPRARARGKKQTRLQRFATGGCGTFCCNHAGGHFPIPSTNSPIRQSTNRHRSLISV